MEGGIAWKCCHQNQVALWISSSRGSTFHAGVVLARSEALFIDPGHSLDHASARNPNERSAFAFPVALSLSPAADSLA